MVKRGWRQRRTSSQIRRRFLQEALNVFPEPTPCTANGPLQSTSFSPKLSWARPALRDPEQHRPQCTAPNSYAQELNPEGLPPLWELPGLEARSMTLRPHGRGTSFLSPPFNYGYLKGVLVTGLRRSHQVGHSQYPLHHQLSPSPFRPQLRVRRRLHDVVTISVAPRTVLQNADMCLRVRLTPKQPLSCQGISTTPSRDEEGRGLPLSTGVRTEKKLKVDSVDDLRSLVPRIPPKLVSPSNTIS